MKSIKILTAFCICLTLTGCFRHVPQNLEDEPKNITIQISNAYADSDFETQHGADIELVQTLDRLYQDSGKIDPVASKSLFAVNFQRDYTNYTYAYYGNQIWGYAVNHRNPKYFIPNDGKFSQEIADKLCTYGALNCLSEGEEFTVDFSQIDNVSILPEHDPKNTGETLYFYQNDRDTIYYDYIIDGDNLYYFQETSRLTDAEVGGSPLYDSSGEYEYATNGKESWYRKEMYDVFYPAEIFEGDYQPEFLADKLKDEYQFEYGFPVHVEIDKDGITPIIGNRCEVFRNAEKTAIVLLNENIVSAWFYDNENMKLLSAVRSYQSDFDMKEYMEHAHEHTQEIENQKKMDANKSAEEWLASDLEKIGMYGVYQDFQSALAVDDDNIWKLDTQPDTVQNYIDRVKNNEPFTYGFWTVFDYRLEYNTVSSDGKNSYLYSDVSSHDNSFDYEITWITLDDNVYYWNEDKNGYDCYPVSNPEENDILYSVPDPFIISREREFQSAYQYQMDNINYTVETWSVGHNRVDFLCRDGGIVAIRYRDLGEWKYDFIARYEMEADSDLIQLPDDAVIFKHNMDDDSVTTEYFNH